MSERNARNISRRDLIRRGAVVGGLAWTAPVIVSSLSSPAGAQVSPPPDNGQTTTTTTTTRSPSQAPTAAGPPPPPVRAEPTFTG